MSSRRTRWAMLALAALVIAWPVPYLEAIRSPNELTRVYLIRAIVDERTIRIDGQVARHGPLTDMAARDGHVYSDKAPGLSLLGVPIYAALRTFRPADSITDRELVRWLRLFLIVVPTVVWMFSLSRWLDALGISRDLSTLAPVAYAVATPAFAYALLFMGHQAAAWMLGLAMAAAWKSRAAPATGLATAGLLSGLAGITEYPTAPMIAAIGILAVAGTRRPWSRSIRFAAAAAIPLVVGAVYHTVAFGEPLKTGYAFLVNPQFSGIYSTGVMGISLPTREALIGLTVGTRRGLLLVSPWLALALFGLFALRDRPRRLLVGILVFNVLLHLWVAAGYSYWIAGWSVGPRHMVPALPALSMLAILGWEKLRAWRSAADHLCRGLVAASAIAVCAIGVTFPGYPEELDDPLFELTFPMIADRQFSASLPHLAGIRSDLAMAPAIVAVAALLVWIGAGRSVQRGRVGDAFRRLGFAASIAVMFWALRWGAREPPSCEAAARAAWLRQTVWEPKDVPLTPDSRPPDC